MLTKASYQHIDIGSMNEWSLAICVGIMSCPHLIGPFVNHVPTSMVVFDWPKGILECTKETNRKSTHRDGWIFAC